MEDFDHGQPMHLRCSEHHAVPMYRPAVANIREGMEQRYHSGLTPRMYPWALFELDCEITDGISDWCHGHRPRLHQLSHHPMRAHLWTATYDAGMLSDHLGHRHLDGCRKILRLLLGCQTR